MPKLARWFIKAGMIYFLISFIMAVLLKAGGLFQLPTIFMTLQPVYFHLFMVGWVTQMIIGVSYWFFPRYRKGQPRGREQFGLAAFWLLNAGLVLRIIGEPMSVVDPGVAAGTMLVLSAVLQWLGGASYVVMIWPRVKSRELHAER